MGSDYRTEAVLGMGQPHFFFSPNRGLKEANEVASI